MPRGPAPETRQAAPRLLITLDAVWGSWLVSTAPGRLSKDHGSHGTVSALVRLLGARQLAQAALIATRPTAARILAGSVVDGLHAISMLLVARTSPRLSEPALASAAAASLLSCYGLRCALHRR